MAINKETKSLGMPWEKEYGYAQAVKVGDAIYLSGQVSHDDNAISSVSEIWRLRCGRHIPTSRSCSHSIGQR
jgi:enamine deaminase RidA (YjgF/YER057c/UK114 family)